ncbi:hypothetical protein FACS189421_01260 [Bacteroidia bacterium]|nr:hypothetical protein FACS189421_01260 [Bacteroidia bacterium]GHT04557.1 hypothetical protein FACS189423_07420 [Bacteroidia bacterium]GHT46105.1 hypothetical protein FACS189440_03410 [Bacteroidia bacterium]
MQYFQQKIEREISIPIQYVHVPDDIVLNDSVPGQITLQISDKGSVLVRHFLGNTFSNFNINLSTLSPDKNTYTIGHSTLLAQTQALLPNSTQILSLHPETIQIRYSLLKKKEVPVRIAGAVSPAAGFMFIDSVHINPSKVWIYGDKESLDTLKWIKTVAVNKENIQKKLDITLQLDVPKGIHLSAQKVKVTAEVEEYTEKKFELPIVCHNLPENIHIRFFPSTVEVVCQLALSNYPLLKENDLEVGMDYDELSRNQGIMISLKLLRKPDWLPNYRIVPETVEYLIEQKRKL